MQASGSSTSGWPKLWLVMIGIVPALGAVMVYGLPTGIIVVGAIFLLLGIWNLWVSLQIVAGDRSVTLREDSMAFSDEKRFLLRTLEDLEYERTTGKIDDDDYEELREQIRNRAQRVLSEDETELRNRAEQLVEDYLRTHEKVSTAGSKSASSTTTKTRQCPSCTTENDLDASFCKRCGKKLPSALSNKARES
ncbi:MAG TPA: hypothetical protein PLJ27_15910 [Polyangiaceae bacterium]|nr:MAG: hypothetical protein BWY17_01520 [Deltaproteobacteria bacterium ADurb.Bin207]HOD23684.1 hypothetical protein [Polyangiaceae bacterium]HOR34136.1 hypothetical protein [Polyangiaceae bacterium]HQB44822.1 hypothetical protein [Polyangiaceae bacterium]HQF23703.1 hypothetical protein [Polyangiaceae bacterium]